MNNLFKSLLVSAIIALSLLATQNARAAQSTQTAFTPLSTAPSPMGAKLPMTCCSGTSALPMRRF